MEFWGSVKQIWTIARHSVVQAIRMKVVIILVAFLLVLVPALPFLLKSDDTVAGQIRMIVTYCVYLTSFLLSILTLFLSAMTLNSEIKGQHIFLLDPKPVPRGVVLLGKWLGVMLINLALLSLMLGATYGLVRYFGRLEKVEGPEAYQEARRLEHERLKANVLTALEVRQPPLPADMGERLDNEVARLKEENLMPEGKTEAWVRQRLFERFSKSGAAVVPPHGTVTWVISDIPKFDGWLVVRFRHYGDKGPYDYALPGEFHVNEGGQPSSFYPGPFQVGAGQTFAVPSSVVQEDGTVEIRYANRDEKVAALFPFQEGITVLFPRATLAENFVRAGIMILLRLTFIAIVGIFASTFLSFPVAVLLTMVVFTVGQFSSFLFTDVLKDVFLFGPDAVPPGTPLHPLDEFTRSAIYYFFRLFPSFHQYDIVPAISSGQFIRTGWIFWCFVWLPLVRGGVLAVAGWIIFNRRELAALTPTT